MRGLNRILDFKKRKGVREKILESFEMWIVRRIGNNNKEVNELFRTLYT